MEVNGDDHNPFKDCVEMLTVYASTLKDKGVRLRYWFVPYRNGDTSVNEIVRQHWLRHHVLSRAPTLSWSTMFTSSPGARRPC